MPNWYWEKKGLRSTPSQLKGMDYKTETRYRQEGVGFIFEVGKTMNLYHLTMATAAVYFHRFYMFHAFQDFSRYLVATCCLFLAGKAEETPKKCKDIVRVVRSLTNDRQYATFGQDPREEVMTLERVLLKTIKFDLQVDHPYKNIMNYALSLGEPEKLQKVVQMSWTFVNDSLRTTLCLRWEPEVIAIAVMHLAIKLSKFEVKNWQGRQEHHKHWWDQFVDNLDTNDLEDICHQVLDLYGEPPTSAKDKADSPPPSAVVSTPVSNPSSNSMRGDGGSTATSRQSSISREPSSKPPPLPPQKTTPPPPKSRPQTPPLPPPSHSSGGSKQPPMPMSQAPLPGGHGSYGQAPLPPMPPQGYHAGGPPRPAPPQAPPHPSRYGNFPPSGGSYHQGLPPGHHGGHPPPPHPHPPGGHYQNHPSSAGYSQPYYGNHPPPGPPYPPHTQHSRY